MKSLSAFYPRILPFLPGCPEPVVDQVLVDAAIEFADGSLVLRQNLDPFNTTVGGVQYDLDPPTTNHSISRVMGVTLGGRELSPGMAEVVRGDLPTANASPRGFYTDRTDNVFTLMLTPPPDAVQTVIVNVSLRPARGAILLDDDLYNIWVEPVVAGAIARAMQIPDQPFSNPAQAQMLLMSVAKQTNFSRIEGMYGFTRASMRVRPRPFY
jgi:hypothetical protein